MQTCAKRTKENKAGVKEEHKCLRLNHGRTHRPRRVRSRGIGLVQARGTVGVKANHQGRHAKGAAAVALRVALCVTFEEAASGCERVSGGKEGKKVAQGPGELHRGAQWSNRDRHAPPQERRALCNSELGRGSVAPTCFICAM